MTEKQIFSMFGWNQVPVISHSVAMSPAIPGPDKLGTPAAIDPPYLYPDYRSTRLRAPAQDLLAVPADLLARPG